MCILFIDCMHTQKFSRSTNFTITKNQYYYKNKIIVRMYLLIANACQVKQISFYLKITRLKGIYREVQSIEWQNNEILVKIAKVVKLKTKTQEYAKKIS